MSEGDRTRPTMVERLRAQRDAHRRRPKIVRVGWVIGGFTLLLAGLAMLILPGPALAVIPVALAILSLEFAWAGRLLEKALVQAERAKQTAKETSAAQRIAISSAIVLAGAAAVAAALLWEIPLIPYV